MHMWYDLDFQCFKCSSWSHQKVDLFIYVEGSRDVARMSVNLNPSNEITQSGRVK